MAAGDEIVSVRKLQIGSRGQGAQLNSAAAIAARIGESDPFPKEFKARLQTCGARRALDAGGSHALSLRGPIRRFSLCCAHRFDSPVSEYIHVLGAAGF